MTPEISNIQIAAVPTTENSAAKQVLLVEDSLLSQKITIGTLKDICCVTCVETANAASKIVAEKRFDLIIADLMLKEGTTFGLIRKFRRMFSPAQLPIIVITSSLDYRTLNKLLLSGVNNAFEKPIPPPILKASVLSLMAEPSMRRPEKGSPIPFECYCWEFDDKFFVFNPDTRKVLSGPTKQAATQSMFQFLQTNLPSIIKSGLVNEMDKVELSIPAS